MQNTVICTDIPVREERFTMPRHPSWNHRDLSKFILLSHYSIVIIIIYIKTRSKINLIIFRTVDIRLPWFIMSQFHTTAGVPGYSMLLNEKSSKVDDMGYKKEEKISFLFLKKHFNIGCRGACLAKFRSALDHSVFRREFRSFSFLVTIPSFIPFVYCWFTQALDLVQFLEKQTKPTDLNSDPAFKPETELKLKYFCIRGWIQSSYRWVQPPLLSVHLGSEIGFTQGWIWEGGNSVLQTHLSSAATAAVPG